jgi:phenylacetate-CoA ligase
MGRSDDMLIIRGVNVFPSQIEEVLLAQGLTSNYQILVDRAGTTDSLEVKVEMTPELFSDKIDSIHKIEGDIVGSLKDMLGIVSSVSASGE